RREKRLLVFVVGRNQEPVLVGIRSFSAIEEAVKVWRVEVQKSQPDRDRLEKAARTLREELWLPISKHLGDVKTVLISPDGVLAQVPFGALPGSKAGSHLLEELTIGYVASGHQLVEMARKPG